MKFLKSNLLARAGITAGLYIALTVPFATISFGAIQLRLSEGLAILPLVFPECAIGLTLGCFLSNLLFSTPIDAVLGTLATLLASVICVFIGKTIKSDRLKFLLGALSTVALNALIVPLTFVAVSDGFTAYAYAVLTVGLGELIAVFAVGFAVFNAIKKLQLTT